MKRYAKYKDSGISWIGEIPEHWDAIKIRYLVKEPLQYGANESGVDYCEILPRYIRITDISMDNQLKDEGKLSLPKDTAAPYILKDGDILFARSGASVGKTFLFKQEYGTSAFAGYLIKASFDEEKVFSKYAYYNTLGNNYEEWKRRSFTQSTIQNIGADKYNTYVIPVPSLEEQKVIAEFLDNKTKQINELVSAKQKQIELLKEYKQAVIAKAVTQGINPKAKMKDSGISWIGQIPEHWECSTLRKHLQFVSEKGHPEEQLLSVTREYGVIVRNTESKEENHNVIPEDLSNYKLVKKGQFAINKMKAWQGSYAVSSYTGIVSPAYYVCELNFEVKEFFSMAIRSKAYVPFFTMYSKGIRVDQWDLSPIGLKTIPFFIPPKDEQKRIVAFVNDKIVKVDSQIASVEKQIANLNEYKQSLISDVVTGKVKVA